MALAARAYPDVSERASTKARPRAVRKTRRVKLRLNQSVRVAMLVVLPIALIVTYVWLTAQLTAQTYRLHDDQALRTELIGRDTDLRRQVAQLESLPRLEAAAAKLHMHVPGSVAIVEPTQAAQAKPATSIAASLDGLRKWLHI